MTDPKSCHKAAAAPFGLKKAIAYLEKNTVAHPIPFTRRKPEAVVNRKHGGSPADWLAIAGTVSLADMRLQRFDGAAWADPESIEEARP